MKSSTKPEHAKAQSLEQTATNTMSTAKLTASIDSSINASASVKQYGNETRLSLRRERRRADPGTLNLSPSKTDESQAEAANINTIIRRMMKGNYIPPMRGAGEYRDAVLDATDLQSAHLMIQEGSEIFDRLPAETRLFFDNDPMKLHEFLMDPDIDVEKGVELGLFKKEEPKTTAPVVENERAEPKATPAVVPPPTP